MRKIIICLSIVIAALFILIVTALLSGSDRMSGASGIKNEENEIDNIDTEINFWTSEDNTTSSMISLINEVGELAVVAEDELNEDMNYFDIDADLKNIDNELQDLQTTEQILNEVVQ